MFINKQFLATLVLIMVTLSSVYANESKEIEFAQIPGDGKSIVPFQMSKTEITNQQYVDFLNDALKDGKITVGEVEPLDQNSSSPAVPQNLAKQMRGYKSNNQQLVFDHNGNRILDLLNIRMTGDHGYDGAIDKWELKNPLNRLMIEYNSKIEKFNVADPKKVDWNLYFDERNLSEGIDVVDSITNWAELQDFWPEGITVKNRDIVSFDRGEYDENVLFAGRYDLDLKLPTHEEVKNWPVIYMEYYSAKAFADYYGYDLPTVDEYKWVVDGGKGYKYGTSDGTISPDKSVYNGHSIADDYQKLPKGGLDHNNWPGQDKGHVQPVASFDPNPYGVYDLSGNVIEWTQSKNDPESNCRSNVQPGFESYITVGSGWTYPEEYTSFDKKCFTETNVGATNDHFGFRIVKR